MPDRERVLGCLYGGAIGDALGGRFESKPEPIWEDNDYFSWRLSDDTQLTLATCEGICSAGHVEPAAIAERFAEWFRQRRLSGLGSSTYKALAELEAGGHWALVGARGEMAAGNGAAMRIAPLAFCLAANDYEHRRIIRDVARITHHHEEAYAGALAVLAAIRLAADDAWQPGHLLTDVAELLPDTLVRDRLKQLAEGQWSLSDVAQQFGTSGYVVESVPLAILGAESIHNTGFLPVLQSLIAAGGDTDTIASMAGQIMGASCGLAELPAPLVGNLPDAPLLRKTFAEFATLVA